MYICTSINICMYVYECTYTYIHIYIRSYVRKCICVHVDTHIFLLCSLACLHILTNACLLRYPVSLYITICVYPSSVCQGECVCMCVRMYAYAFVRVCVCLCAYYV